TNADLAAVLTFNDGDPNKPRQLQTIDLSANAAVFAGTNLTVTAVRTKDGGDGLAAVGYVDATALDGGTSLDLGVVRIGGDLGRINAGNSTTPGPAARGLAVQSLGELGISTQAAGGFLISNLNGSLGFLTVTGDVREAAVLVGGSDGNRLGPVTIGGSLLGGPGL